METWDVLHLNHKPGLIKIFFFFFFFGLSLNDREARKWLQLVIRS